MSILTDAVAAGLADLVREIPAPTGDLGFGSDLSCDTDLTADFAEISGSSSLAVAQSCVRRLGTPRGSLPDDPDYGLDVVELLHKGMTSAEVSALQGQIRNELSKDDRILDGTLVAVLTITGANAFDLSVSGNTAEGPFDLTLALVDGDALLKEINA